MLDDHELREYDPYGAFDREAERLHRYFTTITDDVWQRPSRCEGWSVRDVLGHLRADEDYFHANLDGSVAAFMARMGELGATDLDTGNALGIAQHADVPTADLIAQWYALDGETRAGFRARGDGEVDTAVGAYPARWQAFHLAHELATHADDIAVPVEPGDEPARTAWRAALSRFALVEARPEAKVAARAGVTEFTVGAVSGELPDHDFVEAVASRLPAGAVAPAVLAALAVTP